MTIKKLEKLYLISTIPFIAIALTPLLLRTVNVYLIGILFLLSLFFSFWIRFKKRGNYLFATDILAFFLCFIVFFYWLIKKSPCSIGNVLGRIIIILLLVFSSNSLSCSNKTKRILVYAFFAISLFNMADNIRLNILYPNASEYLNFEWGTVYLSMNVGDTIFVFSSSIFCLICFYYFLFSDRKKVIWFVAFLVALIFIVLSSRALSLITAALGFVILILLRISLFAKKKSRIALYFLFFFILFFVLFLIPPLLRTISNYTNERLSDRLLDLASILEFKFDSSSSDSSGFSRIHLYFLSINTFFRNPLNFLIGIGQYPSDVDTLIANGIGGHSAILDFLPQYGVVGFIPMFLLIILIFKNHLKSCRCNTTLLKLIFSLFIVNAVFNNVFSYQCVMLVFIYVPMISSFRPKGLERIDRYAIYQIKNA